MPLALRFKTWPLASTVATLLALVPTVMGICTVKFPPAWSVPPVKLKAVVPEPSLNASRFSKPPLRL